MKKIVESLTVVSLVLICTISRAQVSIGARAGLSIPNLSAGGSQQNPLNTGYSSRLGPDFAVFAEYRVSTLFSIEPMIEYSSQGGKKDGFQALPVPPALAQLFPPGQVPPYLYATYKSEAKMNYLLVPVLGKFGWDLHPHSPFRLYVDAGPFAGFLLAAKQVTSGNSEFYADPKGQQPLQQAGVQSLNNTQNIKDQLHSFNVGISGNLGLAYHFARNNIFVEGGGNYGFLNIQKGTANGKNNIGAATASLGYAYRLCK
jgi:outer membrane protein with beta-barrel domain